QGVETGSWLGACPLVPVAAEDLDGFVHPVPGDEQVEVGEGPEDRVGVGAVGEDGTLQDHRVEVLQCGSQAEELAFELHRPDRLRVELLLQTARHVDVDVDLAVRRARREQPGEPGVEDRVEVQLPTVTGWGRRARQAGARHRQEPTVDRGHGTGSASWARTSASAYSSTWGSTTARDSPIRRAT